MGGDLPQLRLRAGPRRCWPRGRRPMPRPKAASAPGDTPPPPDFARGQGSCAGHHRHHRPGRQPREVRGAGRARDPRAGAVHLRKPRSRPAAHVIAARRFVIATGSRPLVPPIPGLDATTAPYQRNDLRSARTARHLIIIRPAAIGMELAQAASQARCRGDGCGGRRRLPRRSGRPGAGACTAAREGSRSWEGAEVFARRARGAIRGRTKGGKVSRARTCWSPVGAAGHVEGRPSTRPLSPTTRRRPSPRTAGLRVEPTSGLCVGDAAEWFRKFTHLGEYQRGVIIDRCCLGCPQGAHR